MPKVNPNAILWKIKNNPDIAPLLMDINPTDLSFSYRKLTNRKRTLGGFAEEHWGNELDTLNGNGHTAMFYGPNDTGISIYRRNSTAFANYLRFLEIYRNNGATFDPNYKIINVDSVIMQFGNKQFEGYFETLTTTEDPTYPFRYSYSFSYRVEKTTGEFEVATIMQVEQFQNQVQPQSLFPDED